MAQKRILVTGGAGFIGSALVRHLIGHTQYRVLVLDKLTYAGTLTSLAPVSEDPRYGFVRADICDHQAVAQAFEGFDPDIVVHLAAESHVDRSIDGPGAFIETNLVGTYVLLQAARAQWSALRAEMARISGAIVLIGGAKNQDGQIIDADGVEEELNAAKSVGAFLLPIGSTGGTAKSVCERLIGSYLVSDGNQAVRPNDAELKMLMNTYDPSEITSLVIKLLKKSRNGIERL